MENIHDSSLILLNGDLFIPPQDDQLKKSSETMEISTIFKVACCDFWRFVCNNTNLSTRFPNAFFYCFEK
jgi:hypothetical protein